MGGIGRPWLYQWLQASRTSVKIRLSWSDARVTWCWLMTRQAACRGHVNETREYGVTDRVS
ncbi:MAG TPA: hypothetical protein DCE55_09065 [Planctomycetaceae bacterium]|nr:hypothetical protein [Planctomycetaceae bacterium]